MTLDEAREISKRKNAKSFARQFAKKADAEQWANKYHEVCANLLLAMSDPQAGKAVSAIRELESLQAMYSVRKK